MKLMVTAFLVFLHKETDGSQRPMDLMADLTNDLGVCILQVQSTLQNGNVAFSPYGLASMTILLFEGAAGNTALEIMRVMKLPWNTLLVRIGFRDIHRHLKTYFKSDGFLRGLIMSRDDVCFHSSYQKVLRLYGFDEPETALTYPCTGFVPYSPPPTSPAPSTTEFAVNVSTTSSGPENRTIAPTDEIVTELTQTSQTVTVRNNLTSMPTVEAANPGLARTQDQTLTKSFMSTSETETKATLPVEESITAAFSNTVAAIPAKGNEATVWTDTSTVLSPMERTEASATTTLSPTNNATIEKLNSSSIRNISSLQNASETSTESDFYLSTTFPPTVFPNENFTFTFDTDFTKPTTDSLQTTTSDSFFSDLITSTLLPDTSTIFSASFDFSPKSRLNITTNFTLPTLIPLFNDTSVEEIGFTTFTPFTSPLSSLEIMDFNKSTTILDAIEGRVSGTTQRMSDFGDFSGNLTTVEGTTQSSTIAVTFNETYSLNNTKVKLIPQNTVNASNPGDVKNTLSNATLRSSQLKLDNVSRNNMGENVDPRILPKKSISESNENISGAINVAAESNTVRNTFRTPPNYVNVLSVKQSKTISSKYDIHSVKGSRSRFVRSVLVPTDRGLNTTTAEIVGNLINTLRKREDNTQDVTTTWDGLTRTGSNFSFHSVSITAQSEGRIPTIDSTVSHPVMNDFVNGDTRSIRSFGHNSHHSSNAEWFATPDQNMIRVPVFSYSAMLPFAHIGEIKSKVLEIPLDDYNYSLLVMLPAPEFGIERLLHSLTQISLRRVWNLLRPTPVYASIPKFSIISHVNLRNTLYTVGIRDIFHRYRANLSSMSPDSKLFVRSIEQVVTIYVDKFPSSVYPVPERYVEQHFSASHPFLYFVMDRNSGVSLVAGILSNPSKHII